MSIDQRAAEAPGPTKWARWLAELHNDILTLTLWRTTWKGIIQAAENNPNVPPTHVFTFLAATYSASQAMAVRRLCGNQRREISFRNLLREIEANPGLLARQVDIASVQADLKSLDSGNLRRVGRYVNEYLAHKQETRTPALNRFTFEDLHQAVDELGGLLQKYMLLVQNEEPLLHALVFGDWMAPFRVAWLPPCRPGSAASGSSLKSPYNPGA